MQGVHVLVCVFEGTEALTNQGHQTRGKIARSMEVSLCEDRSKSNAYLSRSDCLSLTATLTVLALSENASKRSSPIIYKAPGAADTRFGMSSLSNKLFLRFSWKSLTVVATYVYLGRWTSSPAMLSWKCPIKRFRLEEVRKAERYLCASSGESLSFSASSSLRLRSLMFSIALICLVQLRFARGRFLAA